MIFQTLRSTLRTFLGVPLTLISFYFIFSVIIKNKEKIIPYLHSIHLNTFLAGIFFLSFYFLIRGIAWNHILKNNKYEVGLSKSLFLFSLSETKRYIPGNIFSFIARVKSFNELRIPKRLVLKFMIIEAFLLVLSSLIFFFFSIPLFFQLYNQLPLTNNIKYVIFVGPLVCFINTIVIILKRNGFKIITKYLNTYLIYILSWLFFGTGSYLVASSFVYLDVNQFLSFLSFFVISWLFGYVFFVVPMGLGIREAIIAYGLAQFMPLPLSSFIAVFLRIALVFSELLYLSLAFINYHFRVSSKIYNATKMSKQLSILFAAMFAYVAYFTYVSFEKHLNFLTGRFDLGNMDQTVWNTINGRIFTLTNPDNVNTISRLAIHADFILILLSPLYFIWSDPRMLLLVQSTVLSLGALFVYLLANEILKNKNISLVFAISYLLNPFVQRQNLFDFHAITLATTFLIAAFYFLIKKKNIFFIIFLLLSVLTKENVYIIAAMLGMYIGIFRKEKNVGRRTIGICITALSLAAFFLLVAKFIPEARGSHHLALSYYQDFGYSPFEIVKNIFFEPHKTFSYLLKFENFQYLAQLFLPVGFLSLLSPLYLIFSIPDLAINLLSNNRNLISINFHYAATIIPFVYISAIFGAHTIIQAEKRIFTQKKLLYYILVFSLLSTYLIGVLPGSQYPSIDVFTKKLTQKEVVSEYLKRIPPYLSVSSTNNLGAHLSYREKLYTIPNGIDTADVLLFLFDDGLTRSSSDELKKIVNRVIQNNTYVLVLKDHDFIVFIKKEVANSFSFFESNL